jgi:uncharacterized protein YndB with AHSA1/START domain
MTAATVTSLIFTRTERDLVLTGALTAAPDRVYAAWTGRFKDWWGPHGMSTPSCELDLRSGGKFATVMRAPDGTEYLTRGVFLEVVPGKRIVFTDAFDPGWEPHPDIFFTADITFETGPNGGTKLTARARHWSADSRQRHEEMGFVQGWGESLERLASLA